MQTALIAGGAGFIGSHLVESLIDDYSVVCVDNLSTGSKKNIGSLLENKNFKLIEADITKPLELSQKVDLIFHLASPASPSEKNTKSYIHYPVETMLANSLGTYNLLELARQNDAKFLFASSSEVYGDPDITPQNENYFGYVNPIGVRSVYDEGKRFGEALVMSYFRKFNLDTKIARIFNTYGPRMPDDGRVVINFIEQARENSPLTVYGEGEQTRSFCFVDDLVLGLKKFMTSSGTKGEVINLGNPTELKIIDLAQKVKQLSDSNSEFIFEDLPQDDPKRRCPDISKAKRLLDWEPKINLTEGLKKTIQYIESLK